MKRIRYFVILCFTCFLCSCYHDTLFEDVTLEEENSVMSIKSNPLPFDSLFPKTNGESVGFRLGAYYLNANQWGMMCFLGQDLMDKGNVLSKMAQKLYEKGVRITCAVNPSMIGGIYVDKDAVFDSDHNIIYCKSVEVIMSQRIILHELLHAFQANLAGVEYTDKNEGQTEFEVLLMYDVFQYKMYGIFTSEGGSGKEYQDFVCQIANFELFAGNESSIKRLTEMFEKHYKNWAGGDSVTAITPYRPSLLIYFSSGMWNR